MDFNHISTIYVHQVAGRDDRSGLYPAVTSTGDGPVATISRALDRVRELRRAGVFQPITLRLLGDSYYLENTMVLDEALGALTIDAEKSNFLLSGGMPITGFVRDVFNDVSCVSVEVPTNCRFIDLYVNGRRAAISRYPAEGALYAESVENEGRNLPDHSKWFIARPGDLDGVTVKKGTQLGFSHCWVDEHTPIENYDPVTRRVDMKYLSRFLIGGKPGAFGAMEYWLENLPECVKNPGEWYLESDEGKLYYIPREDDLPPEELVAIAPRLRHLAVISGKNIVLKGLTMSHTAGDYVSRDDHHPLPEGEACASDCQSVCCGYGALEFRGASNCRVENCHLTHYGVHGIAIQEGCRTLTVQGCDFTDGGAGGITITGGEAGSDLSTHTYGNRIVNNVMDGLGRRYAAGCGILLRHTYDNLLSHNTICNIYYSGISIGWVWGYADNISRDNIVEYNHIHHIGDGLLSDMGGIYLLGKQPGTVVRGNCIHHVICKHYGGWGIYSDEGSSYHLYEDNLVYACNSNAYVLHYGTMNVLRNNILCASKGAVARATRTEMQLGTLLEGNILVSEGAPVYMLTDDNPAADYTAANLSIGHMEGRRNLLFNTMGDVVVAKVGEVPLNLAAAQALGREEDSVIADPMFKDPENGDYSLLPDSPALALGFKPLDMSRVGAWR